MGMLCKLSSRLLLKHPAVPGRTFSKFADVVEEVEDANSRGKGQFRVLKTPDKGYGVFAERSFSAGDLCFSSKPLEILQSRDSHSVQVSWTSHVHMDLPGRFINHCCTANVGILNNASGAFDFFALENIQQGDELLWGKDEL
jgi:hypothetical protein